VARIVADPGDPERIAELRLDQILAPFDHHADICPPTAVRMAVARIAGNHARDTEVCLRRLELDLDPFREAIPFEDGQRLKARTGQFQEPGTLGAPLLVYGARYPASWQEAYWLAGQVDGVYLGESVDHVKALRCKRGTVTMRGFGEPWIVAGRVEVVVDATV
jgi:hypothetical protein